MVFNFKAWLIEQGIPSGLAQLLDIGVIITAIIAVSLLCYLISKHILVRLLEAILIRSKNRWDDKLVERDLIKKLSLLVPVAVFYMAVDILQPQLGSAAELLKRAAMTLFVIAGVAVLNAFFSASNDIYKTYEVSARKPIRGYIDALRIISYLLAVIFIISILTDKSPWGILSVLGGFTVVLILVFKDTILGFVASLQISAHDMVRVGDWIEVPKYGADGDVIDMSIHTVKVRNWDKTISTIPTYHLVTDTFKNWRGMSESGGRRIKRAINIDVNSIKFCSDEMLERFNKFGLISEYINNKKDEIAEYNEKFEVNTSEVINGRRQTNIGVFRAYIVAYLKNHPKIHQNMTFLVRHLAPTPQGLPIEIYVFSNDQAWARYEAIQADIFDHLLAAVPEFDLRVFQDPTGYDFMHFKTGQQ